MKAGIHPQYNQTTVVCSCGNTFVTRSTSADREMHVELCSECHPFYTGKQKLVDTGGRIDRFERRYGRRTKKS
jgi:large subunit ribosomal protein L31